MTLKQVSCVPNLYIGDYDAAENNFLLYTTPITHIVSLYRTPCFPNTYEYLLCTIEDNPDENILQFFEPAIEFIQKGLDEGLGVFVHCAGGVSRSATIVVAFIMNTLRVSADAALELLRRDRKSACPNHGFMLQLYSFQSNLKI